MFREGFEDSGKAIDEPREVGRRQELAGARRGGVGQQRQDRQGLVEGVEVFERRVAGAMAGGGAVAPGGGRAAGLWVGERQRRSGGGG